MARQSHTLAEVAEDYLPPEWTDGPRWLSRRLNAGQLRGFRAGRTWMMRDSDIDYMLEKLANDDKVTNPKPSPGSEAVEPRAISFAEALSPRSRAQLRAVSK
jgi:hypothetical protein